MEYIELIVEQFIALRASDLHLSVGKIPMIRVNSCIEHINGFNEALKEDDIETFITKNQRDKLADWIKIKNKQINSVDGSLTFQGRRFRTHLYRSSSGIVMVFRILQEIIPTLDELNMPSEIERLKNFKRGLVLVTGATGSGKSTTLASLLEDINNTKSRVVVTVEDPIEYIYKDKLCRIEQREVGIHVESFGAATRDMMREDPDIILVGEMRDVDTIKNAITLSETGHLVFSTLHTKSVIDTIDRMVDVFPAEQQQQIRIQLSFVLIGIINQTLIKSKSQGVVPLCEVMVNDDVTASMIRQSKSGNTLKDYLRSSKNGSIHIVDNVVWHIENGRLTFDECKEILGENDIVMVRAMLEERGIKAHSNNTNIRDNRDWGIRTNGKRRF